MLLFYNGWPDLFPEHGRPIPDTPLEHEAYKVDLDRKNLEAIANSDPRLAQAINRSGGNNANFGIGESTASKANELGKTWVGDGARLVSDQVKCPGCLKSADGKRIYRPPTVKNTNPQFNPTGVQANFVTLNGQGAVIGNGHLIIRGN
jgi:filamentous hemagglutinin